jgi:hypothetical protein
MLAANKHNRETLLMLEKLYNIANKTSKMINHYAMEQATSKNLNNCWNTNISFYIKTSGGQSYNLYLNVVHFFHTCVN